MKNLSHFDEKSQSFWPSQVGPRLHNYRTMSINCAFLVIMSNIMSYVVDVMTNLRHHY